MSYNRVSIAKQTKCTTMLACYDYNVAASFACEA